MVANSSKLTVGNQKQPVENENLRVDNFIQYVYIVNDTIGHSYMRLNDLYSFSRLFVFAHCSITVYLVQLLERVSPSN